MISLRSILLVTALLGVVWIASSRPWAASAERLDPPVQAPEFTHQGEEDWINSRPLTLTDLEGRVVLVDFWTYGCLNCRRSFPWLKSVEARFGEQGLTVVGVHTPEFKHEMNRARVQLHVKKFDLDHPVMVDNDFSYWEAMDNRYWPTFYLIDKSGRIRGQAIGEIRPGGDKAAELEAHIEALLSEKA